MKFLLSVGVGVFGLTLASAGAQTAAPRAAAPPAAPVSSTDIKITFTDGRVQAASAVRRTGGSILAIISLGGGKRGEIGYPAGTVRRVEFPVPPQLKTAAAALAAGHFNDALAQINPVVTAQGEFRSIPGNQWAAAAVIKVDALLALKLDREAEALINQLAASTKDPELLSRARLSLAVLWLRTGKATQALEVFDQTIAGSKSPQAVARAWQNKGDALAANKDFDGALLAYLRVPIFYAEERTIQPAALLGSARAYEALGDLDRAKGALAELTSIYGSSPEAASAKDDLKRIEDKSKTN